MIYINLKSRSIAILALLSNKDTGS